jgi:ribosome-associated translation inhibitor RaiA
MMDSRIHLVKDIKAMRMDIAHLRALAASNTDERVLAEIERMIQELERRIRRDGNGFDQHSDSRGEAFNAPA